MANAQVLDDNIYEQRARRSMEAGAGEAGSASLAGGVHQASESTVHLSKGVKEEEGNVDSMETDEEPAVASGVPSSTTGKSSGVAICIRHLRMALFWRSLMHCTMSDLVQVGRLY